MSISNISANLGTDAAQANSLRFLAQRKQDFSELAGAINSGNLAGARQAYSSLESLFSKVPSSGGTVGSKSKLLQSDFRAVGEALHSGDLEGAKNALLHLRSDYRAIRQHTQPSSGSSSGSGAQTVPSQTTAGVDLSGRIDFLG